MKKIFFLAAILTLMITPAAAEKFVSTDKDYRHLNYENGKTIKASPNDANFKREFSYFAKDKTAFFYSDERNPYLLNEIIPKQATISKYKNFDALTEEFLSGFKNSK